MTSPSSSEAGKVFFEWMPVETLSTAELIAQRTNLARHRLVARIAKRLLEVQAEIDRRLEQKS